MEAVQAFQATDWSIFKTADDCQNHEVSLLWSKLVDEFQKSEEWLPAGIPAPASDQNLPPTSSSF